MKRLSLLLIVVFLCGCASKLTPEQLAARAAAVKSIKKGSRIEIGVIPIPEPPLLKAENVGRQKAAYYTGRMEAYSVEERRDAEKLEGQLAAKRFVLGAATTQVWMRKLKAAGFSPVLLEGVAIDREAPRRADYATRRPASEYVLHAWWDESGFRSGSGAMEPRFKLVAHVYRMSDGERVYHDTYRYGQEVKADDDSSMKARAARDWDDVEALLADPDGVVASLSAGVDGLVDRAVRHLVDTEF